MDSEVNSASARFSLRRSEEKESTGVSPWSFNDIAWTQPATFFNSKQTTLAVQSRLKLFFEKHDLGFRDMAAVIMAAGELKKLITTKQLRESKIVSLNKLFPSGAIEIEAKVKTDKFKCSAREYKYAVFHFKKAQKTINVLFLEDHDKLTPDEITELKIQDAEKHHLACPGLEGVWFINPASAASKNDISRNDTVKTIESIWRIIADDIQTFDPYVDKKRAPFISKLYHVMDETFQDIKAKVLENEIDPFIRLNVLTSVASEKISDPQLHDVNREKRIGFFATAGNPLHLAHIQRPLSAMSHFSLDTIIMCVQGKIQYKRLLPSERVSVPERHAMTLESARSLYPLIRYTDLGSDENSYAEGAEQLQRLLLLNPEQAIHVFYLIGAENKERMWRYIRQQYEAFKKYNINSRPNHKITFAVTRRGEYGARISQDELEYISREIHKDFPDQPFLPCAIVGRPDVDLEISSTYYRVTQDPAYVPPNIHAYAKSHGYYGHPPIDPNTGKPVTDSQEQYFRMRLEPIAKTIASQIKTQLEDKPIRNTVLVSIDGNSGSGKTTVAEEVARYLQEHGIDAVIIPLDMFLKNRSWRLAVQKIVTGKQLTDAEKSLVGDLIRQIESGKEYLGEELFFDQEAIAQMLEEINKFCRSDKNSYILKIPDAYDQIVKERRPKEFILKKGMAIIFEGKYANREDLIDYYDLRYRLLDAPDRTEARFQIRSRQLSPDDADMQIIFYSKSLTPSYEAYNKRTKQRISAILDLRKEDWLLVKKSISKDSSQANPKPVSEPQPSVAGDGLARGNAAAQNVIAKKLPSLPEYAAANRIHAENLKYQPSIPEKTILCHIITDSILPAEQQSMLKMLEQDMEKKDKNYSERVVCLSGANVDNPNRFVEELKSLMDRKQAVYRAEGYAKVVFDVACPNIDIVRGVQKELSIPALAFDHEEGDIVQVEGIILALRALNSGEIDKLRAAYRFLTGKESISNINDINELARSITFTLPVNRVDYTKIKEINDLIRENIKQAA